MSRGLVSLGPELNAFVTLSAEELEDLVRAQPLPDEAAQPQQQDAQLAAPGRQSGGAPASAAAQAAEGDAGGEVVLPYGSDTAAPGSPSAAVRQPAARPRLPSMRIQQQPRAPPLQRPSCDVAAVAQLRQLYEEEAPLGKVLDIGAPKQQLVNLLNELQAERFPGAAALAPVHTASQVYCLPLRYDEIEELVQTPLSYLHPGVLQSSTPQTWTAAHHQHHPRPQ